MNKDIPKLPDDPRDAAAHWFARVHSGNFTVAEREHFRFWRQADARNAQEYRALDEIWQATGMLPEDDLRALLAAPESAHERLRRARRRWMIGAGAACAMAVAGGVLGYGHVLDRPDHVLRHATARGEQRVETLPDGSVVEMNVATRLAVRYYHHRRVVELIEGEAAFSVVGSQDRPFFVQAGDVAVRVTGTVFNVRRGQAQISVAVESGAVEVTAGRGWARETAMLAAGMAVHARPGQILDATPADVAAMTAWRQGKVVFRDQPLEDVVREMNRYLAHPIHLTDSRLKRLSMAGVFRIENAETFLEALQAQMPVAIIYRPDGSVSLSLLR